MNIRSCLVQCLLFGMFTFQIHAQWVWQNPKPTGNDILNVKFIDNQTGWSVGNCGTIIKTTDGGRNWTPIITNYTCDFTTVYPVDADNIWIVGYGYSTNETLNDPSFKVLNSVDGGKHWDLKLNGANIPFDTASNKLGYLEDLYFMDPSTGFAVGDSGVILKTTDGGNNWVLQQQSKYYHFKSVQFFDTVYGFVAGGSRFITTGHIPQKNDASDDGIILKTTDGGITWQTALADTISFTDMYFLTPQIGWAVGGSAWSDGGVRQIMKTTDGGESWNKMLRADTIPYITNIFFKDENNGWAVGAAGTALKTTDSGEHWEQMYPAYYYLADVYCFDALHVIAVGREHAIVETTDGGNVWRHQDTSILSSGSIRSIYFCNPDTGLIIMGSLFRTTDKGSTWEDKGMTGLLKITGDRKHDCWGVGYNGKIIHSTDAGNTWVVQTSGVSARLQDVKFVSSTAGWTVGDDYILRTTDGGNTWNTVGNQTNGGFSHVVAQSSNSAWVYGYQDIRTTDSGISWHDAWYDLDSICAVSFINPDTGWANKGNGFYRTYDGGITWDEVMIEGGTNYSQTQFVDANNGWTYDYSAVSATHDGGKSWWAELWVKVYQSIVCAYYIDSTHGWVGGDDGSLVRFGYPELLTSVPINNGSVSKPNQFLLSQNFPNPFNTGTIISYQIKVKSHVKIKIYDALGKEVKLLENKEKNIGEYIVYWDGTDNTGHAVASGVYFYKLNVQTTHQEEGNSQFLINKMLLIK